MYFFGQTDNKMPVESSCVFKMMEKILYSLMLKYFEWLILFKKNNLKKSYCPGPNFWHPL